jgi:hypothetical protein
MLNSRREKVNVVEEDRKFLEDAVRNPSAAGASPEGY